MCSSFCHPIVFFPWANLSPLLKKLRCLRSDGTIAVNGDLDSIFLLFAQLVLQRESQHTAEDQTPEKRHHQPTMGWLVFPSRPQDTHLPWLKTSDAQKYTHGEEKAYCSAGNFNQGWLLHTLFVFRVHNEHSFPFSFHISLVLASSPSPFPSKQPGVACQGSKLLALSGL